MSLLLGEIAAGASVRFKRIFRPQGNVTGTGLCLSKGTFAGRYVVPLHDEEGQLVGYAGRSLDDTEPRYLFAAGDGSRLTAAVKGVVHRHGVWALLG